MRHPHRRSGVRPRFRPLARVLAVATTFALVAAACGDGGDDGEAGTAGGDQPFAGQTFTIGNLSSYSGALSAYGTPIGNALHLAADEVNARGGLLGAQIEIIDADTASDANVAVQEARRLLEQEEVDVMFGVEGSFMRDAIMPVVEQHQTILLYPANYEGERYSDYLFVLGMTPTQEFNQEVGRFLIENGGTRWYLLAADYVATVNINKFIQHEMMPDLGAELVGCEAIPLDVNEFGPTVERIKASGADVVVNNLIGAHTIPFQQQAAAAGLTPDDILMVGTAYQQVTIDGMGDTAEGAYRPISWNQDIDTPENEAFVEAYESEYPQVPAIYISEAAYNSVLALEAAVEEVRSLETEDLINGLEGLSFTAPSGELTIRPDDHHVDLNVYLTQVEDGKFVTVESFGQVAPTYDQREEVFSSLEKCG